VLFALASASRRRSRGCPHGRGISAVLRNGPGPGRLLPLRNRPEIPRPVRVRCPRGSIRSGYLVIRDGCPAAAGGRRAAARELEQLNAEASKREKAAAENRAAIDKAAATLKSWSRIIHCNADEADAAVAAAKAGLKDFDWSESFPGEVKDCPPRPLTAGTWNPMDRAPPKKCPVIGSMGRSGGPERTQSRKRSWRTFSRRTSRAQGEIRQVPPGTARQADAGAQVQVCGECRVARAPRWRSVAGNVHLPSWL